MDCDDAADEISNKPGVLLISSCTILFIREDFIFVYIRERPVMRK